MIYFLVFDNIVIHKIRDVIKRIKPRKHEQKELAFGFITF